jgi:predicted nucleic acid-binding protein
MIFLDASFIVAYANADDQHHGRAMELAGEIDGGAHGERAVSEYVLDEVTTVLLSRTKSHELAVSTGRELMGMLFIRQEPWLLERTWEIFSAQKKPYISFTDCNTIAVCEQAGITELATFDDRLAEKSGLVIIR